jgi:hypothetical protein
MSQSVKLIRRSIYRVRDIRRRIRERPPRFVGEFLVLFPDSSDCITPAVIPRNPRFFAGHNPRSVARADGFGRIPAIVERDVKRSATSARFDFPFASEPARILINGARR